MTGCCANDGGQWINETTYDITKEYYGKVLSTNKDLKTTACTAAGRPTGVVAEIIAKVGGMMHNTLMMTTSTRFPTRWLPSFTAAAPPSPSASMA